MFTNQSFAERQKGVPRVALGVAPNTVLSDTEN